MRARRAAAVAASLAMAATTVGAVGAPPAHAALLTFANTADVDLVDKAPANPYPSVITVADVVGTTTKVEVVLHGLDHDFPADLDVLLVGPGGQKVMLMSDAGGDDAVFGVTLRFTDGAPAPSDPLVSGTYGPANAGDDPMPAPAPPGPYVASFDPLEGIDPNGEWQLFIVDDALGADGFLDGGWSLELTTTDPPPPPPGPCASAAEDGFTDVAPGNVHEANIDCIVAFGITTGTTATTYSPSATVSRGQMASFVARTIEAADVALGAAPPDAFGDDQGTTHELRTNQLAQAGVIGANGETGTSYFPSGDMRRDHMASFLFEAYALIAGEPLAAGPDAFDDDDGNPHEAAIDALAAADVLSGTGAGTYDPNGTVTRGQMGSFLARFLTLLATDGLLPA